MLEYKYVLTKYGDGVLSFTLDTRENRLTSIAYTDSSSKADSISIGDIFVAKVKNVVKNINAAFVEYAPDKMGYVSLENKCKPVLVNRAYDGRLIAGDEVIVQLEKEAVRTKEPVFTTGLSIAGKYCVVSNAKPEKGVSNKCTRAEKEQLITAVPDDISYGVVVRTNAASLLGASLEPVTIECIKLCARMDKLLNDGRHRTCYSRIFKVPEPYFTSLRDDARIAQNSGDCQIITDDRELYEQLIDFMELNMPELVPLAAFYEDESYPLKKLYSVDTKIKELLAPKVWLRSGAYLVIEKTEAMYVIDVNSGKNIVKKENAEFIYNINCEAAEEIIRQIRLRNLSGIIMVDFINMDSGYEDMLMQRLKGLAAKEKVLTSVVDITPLGIVEITRKKTTKTLAEQLKGVRVQSML